MAWWAAKIADHPLDPTLDLGGGVVDALRKLEKQVNYALLDGLRKSLRQVR